MSLKNYKERETLIETYIPVNPFAPVTPRKVEKIVRLRMDKKLLIFILPEPVLNHERIYNNG